jgi:FkbM family methyltransferase
MNALKALALKLLPEAAVMHLQAADHYVNGEHELRLLKQLCRPGCTAIDAGANIGSYAYFLRHIAAAVHAYEPNPELAARLARRLPGVRVRPVALSDHRGRLTLRVPLDGLQQMNHELASVAQDFQGPTADFAVEATTIDAENLADVGFIKIDVEQHEREVLRGAMQTIIRCRPVLLVEIYPLKYASAVQQEFAFVLEHHYCGWFSLARRWHPLTMLDAAVHLQPAHFGNAELFIGNNLLLFPAEHPLAARGPR